MAVNKDFDIENIHHQLDIPKILDNLTKSFLSSTGVLSYFKSSKIDNLVMRFLALDEKRLDRNLKMYFKNTRNEVLNILSQDKPYKHTNYGKNSSQDIGSFKHYTLALPDYKSKTETLNKLNNKIERGEQLSFEEKNELSILFFNIANDKKLLNIPLPFLSTPTLLLVVNDDKQDEIERAAFVNGVFNDTREGIYNYIYNLLINNLQILLDSEQVVSSKDLVYKYVEEVCKVLLPIKYGIAFDNEALNPSLYKDYIKNQWQVSDIISDSEFQINLITGDNKKHTIGFILTSFHFPVINTRRQNRESVTTQWFHKFPNYNNYKEQAKTMLESIFSLIYKQWDKNQQAQINAVKSATSRIVNRNYAHHIGSHVSHRATLDKIIERIKGRYDLNLIDKHDFNSLINMENCLVRYKDERNEYISSLESTNNPVIVDFYKDIIAPFVENSLLMDNIAKGENICWESENPDKNDNIVKKDGVSKLRIRVFYNKEIIQAVNSGSPCELIDCCKNNDKPCFYKDSDDLRSGDRLLLSHLGINEDWVEIMALYEFEEDDSGNEVCIHCLPYFKQYSEKENKFYKNIRFTQDDIKIAIPGTLGAHSIFSILENFIRNTAKHASSNIVSSNLPVNIIIKVSKAKNESGNKTSDFYKFEITTDVPTIYNTGENEKSIELDKIEKALKEPIDLNTKALGFADMRINATMLAFEEINQNNFNKSIDCIVYPESSLKNQSVGFSMLLTKPCKIVFVGNSFNSFNDEYCINAGIRQFDSPEECIKEIGDKPRAFEFAVVDSNVFNEFEQIENANKFLKVLPWRVLVPENKESCNKLLQMLAELRRLTFAGDLTFKKNEEANALLNKCWDAWLRNRWQQPYRLNMFFDKYEGLEKKHDIDLKNSNLCFDLNVVRAGDEIKDHKNENELNKCCFEVFYDRHGRLSSLINMKYGNDYSNLSWEYFDKNNPDFDIISTDQLDNPERSFSKLIESGIHKILVIDERAREIGLKDKTGNWLGKSRAEKQYSLYASTSRVFIADSFVIENKEVLFESDQAAEPKDNKVLQVVLQGKDQPISFKGKLSEQCKDIGSDIYSKFDTIIIHRTMLTKVINSDMFGLLDHNFPNIIVTTGGGTLTYDKKIMDRIRVLPFSIVNKYLLNGNIAKNCVTDLI